MWVLPSPNAALIIETPEPLSGPIVIESHSNQLDLSPITSTIWATPLNTPLNDTYLAVRASHKKIMYYKIFESPLKENKKLSQKTMYPIQKTVQGFDTPYKPIDFSNQNVFNPISWLPPITTANISIKGIKTFSVRTKYKRGDKSGFTEGTQRDELLRLSIKGQLNDVTLESTIQDSSTVLDDTNKNSASFKHKQWEVYFGEYGSELNQLELMSYNKKLDGIKAIYHQGPYYLSAMISESKGQAAFDKIFGKNSQGPYALSQKPLVLYSEKVVYLGQTLVRDLDYSIDYELGQITFKKIFIPESDILTVSYEFSDTTFKKTFTGMYAAWQPTQNVTPSQNTWFKATQMGMAYQNLSDKGNQASTSNAIVPKTHIVTGFHSNYFLWSTLQGHTEVAVSNINSNDSTYPSHQSGMAFNQIFSLKEPHWSASTFAKHLQSEFKSIGNAYLQPNFWSYGGQLDLVPSSELNSSSHYGSDSYLLNSKPISSKVFDTALFWKNIGYSVYLRNETNLANTPNMMNQDTSRHSVSLTLQPIPILELKPGYQIEKQKDSFSITSNYTSQTAQMQARIVGIDALQLAANADIQWQTRDVGGQKRREVYGLTSLITFSQEAQIDGTLKLIQDSQEGKSALSVLNYMYRPFKALRLNGNYTLETITEQLGLDNYRVMKHQGNFQFSLRPINGQQIGYKFKPQFSEIKPLNNLRYEDRLTHQYSLSSDLGSFGNVGVDYKTSSKTLLDKNKLPMALVSQKGMDRIFLMQTDSSLFESGNLRTSYEQELMDSDTLQSSPTPNFYDHIAQINSRQSIEYTQPFFDVYKIGVAYRGSQTKSTQQLSPQSTIHFLNHTAETSLEWNPSAKLNVKGTASSTQQLDLTEKVPTTYLGTPRLDFRYKPTPEWNWSGFAEFTTSFAGLSTFKKKASLMIRYDTSFATLIEINISFQIDYEGEIRPQHYDTYDILLKSTLTF